MLGSSMSVASRDWPLTRLSTESWQVGGRPTAFLHPHFCVHVPWLSLCCHAVSAGFRLPAVGDHRAITHSCQIQGWLA